MIIKMSLKVQYSHFCVSMILPRDLTSTLVHTKDIIRVQTLLKKYERSNEEHKNEQNEP